MVRGSNPGGGQIFRTCPNRPWAPHSLLYNVYRAFSGDKERPGRDADSSPPSSAVCLERVELYLYSPYGPYGLYRASVSVQGCTLPYLSVCTRVHFTFTSVPVQGCTLPYFSACTRVQFTFLTLSQCILTIRTNRMFYLLSISFNN